MVTSGGGNMERKAEILKLLGEGLSVKEVCAKIGITKRTFFRWKKSDPDFAIQCDMIMSSHSAAKKEKKEAEIKKNAEESSVMNDQGASPVPYIGPSLIELTATAANRIREAMKDGGLYKKALEPQILAAASTWATAQTVFSGGVAAFAPLQVEISREGNLRLAKNPAHDMYIHYMDIYTTQLRALGLNYDSKKKPEEEDGRESFFRMLGEEEDDD